MIADIFAATLTGAALNIDLTHPRDPSLARSFGLTRANVAGIQVTEDSALGLASFWRGCNIIANGVAKPPASIKRVTSKGSQDATEHQHFSLVNARANDFNSACDLRRTLQLHALIWGNGIAKLNRVGNRAVEAIPLLPDRTGMAVFSTGKNKIVEPSKIDRASESMTIKYVTRIGNDPIVIDPADVIHIRGLSYNGLWGFPVVETLADAIGSAIAPRDYGAKMFAQGALSSGILFMPPGLDEQQQERFITAVHAGSTGLGQAHRWMVLEDGSDFKPLNLPPEHAQMLQTLEHKTRDIANVIGIQPHKLGDTARKSYNSLEQSNQEHLDDDLDPWLQKWEEELSNKLLTAQEKSSGSHFVEMDRKSLQRTNLAAITSHVASWRQWGIYSANDGRKMQGLNDIGSQGDIYLVPSNMIPATAVQQTIPAGPGAAPLDFEDQLPPPPDEEDEAEAVAAPDQREAKRRLCRTLSRQSERHAQRGGVHYCEWLERLSLKPPYNDPELEAVKNQYVDALDSLTRPPYEAANLFVNQAAALSQLEIDILGD